MMRRGGRFPKVNFSCLNGQYPVTLNEIHIFEQAVEHLKIDVTVLQYDMKFEKDECSNKKRVIYPLKPPFIE